MAKNFLSAEELWKKISATDGGLPQRGGIKEYAPDDSWLQAKKLDYFYQERQNAIGQERVKQFHTLAQGEWIDNVGKVLCTKKTGRFWEHVGHDDAGKSWLLPEEAVFLVDQGMMEVHHGGLPLSLHEVFGILSSAGISIAYYFVYAHLSRLGYTVRRHDPCAIVTTYEKKLKLNLYHNKKGKRKREKQANENEKSQHNEPGSKELKSFETSSCSSPLPSDSFSDKNQNVSNQIQTTSGGLQTENKDSKIVSPVPDFTEINFVDFAKITGGTIELRSPDSCLLPSGIELNEGSYTINKPATVQKNESWEDCLEFSHAATFGRLHSSARNWTEYKAELDTWTEDKFLSQSPVSAYWHKAPTPLIKPSEAKSYDAIFDKLKIIKNITSAEVGSSDFSSQPVDIAFDVFLPNSTFKKSTGQTPDVRVVVVIKDEPPPSLAQLVYLQQHCSDNIPVQWAVVDHGNVAFYSFSMINLPPP